MKRMGIGLQMFTLREELAKDFKGVLREVAAMGYEGVEFAGYGGLSAEELRDLLQELNLKAIGSHVNYQKLKDHLDEEISYLQTIGGQYIICPYLVPEERKDWERHFAFFEAVAKQVANQGLTFAYHNHDFEFQDKVGGLEVFDALYQTIAPELLKVEMDIGWVQFVGKDPLEYMKKYSGRLPLLHLKDFRRGEDGLIDTLELGRGLINLPEVIRAASEAGTEWLIVEQDKCQNPPLECVSTSMKWLHEHYLSKL
ncbi:sugar phosphate isomerase/epimerase [Paenibacillus sp. tmac-D7]|uniref:sugar phosphate isomerase/epimerase family protein n=1 Tax=Paenibacillus sp. tmac-D7 TaxID=2591462 RepID=UPI001141FC5A|nr:sugar phosphate isomerase/epimerase [Paenibacillus sp. tmac-D7]